MNFTKFSSSIILFMFIILPMFFNSSGASLNRVRRAEDDDGENEGMFTTMAPWNRRKGGHKTSNRPHQSKVKTQNEFARKTEKGKD